MANSLQRIRIGDAPDAWSAAGFTVDDGTVVLGKTVLELAGNTGARGILGWAIEGLTTDIDGLPAIIDPEHSRPKTAEHPNMAFAIDHVVVASKHPAHTATAFESVGMDQRKIVAFERADGTTHEQRFFWAGRVIVELIGPRVPDEAGGNAQQGSKGTATFWGLSLVTANLEIATSVLGEALSTPKDAVQPGRKIATVRTKALDISVPIALMSPHVANLGEPSPTT